MHVLVFLNEGVKRLQTLTYVSFFWDTRHVIISDLALVYELSLMGQFSFGSS